MKKWLIILVVVLVIGGLSILLLSGKGNGDDKADDEADGLGSFSCKNSNGPYDCQKLLKDGLRQSPEVCRLQKWLNVNSPTPLSSPNLKVDGWFGKKTRAAVKAAFSVWGMPDKITVRLNDLPQIVNLLDPINCK